MIELIDRAARDPEFLAQLKTDSLGEGVLAETLQARLSFSLKAPDPCAGTPDPNRAECFLPDAGRRG
jgi:hypothetical protein